MFPSSLRRLATLTLLPLAVALSTTPALAEDKPTRWAEAGAGSLLLQGGWGIQAEPEDQDPDADAFQTGNAYAFGLGLRGGYTFPFKLYVGGRAGYYFGRDGWSHYRPGGSVNVSDGFNEIGAEGGNIVDSQSVLHFGPEVGYDFVLGPIVLRPSMPAGLLVHLDEECFSQACDSFNSNQFFLGAGLSIFGSIGALLIGVDSTFIAPLDEPEVSGGLFSLIVGWQPPASP